MMRAGVWGAMVGVAIITGGTMAGASPARAEGPSFACDQAKAPVELLICNDAVLADQDARLAEVFSAARKAATPDGSKAMLTEQREWLKSRLTACAIRPTGDAPSDPELWAWAGCLSKQYDARLSALKAPPVPAPVQSPHVKDADFVHPLCLDYALGGSMGEPPPVQRQVPLKTCNAAYAHIPVEENEGSPGSMSVVGLAEGFSTWFSYQPVATLPSGEKLAISLANGGGTGTFSSLVSYKIDAKGQLSAKVYPVGGDRCNGGISTAAVDGRGVRVSQAITPTDLGAMMGLSDQQAQDLPFCAACCLGEVEGRLAVPLSDDATPTPDVVRIDDVEVLNDSDAGPRSPEKCLLTALKKVGASPPYTLTLPQVQGLKAPYLACLKG